MKNLIPKGLVMFAGFAGVSAMNAQTDPQSLESSQVRSSEDVRIRSLRQFFQRLHSPAQALSEVFVREADTNGLDWRLLPGLALIESGGGKHCRQYNLFGWSNGTAAFSSFTEGIRHVAWYLSNSRIYRNKSVDRVLLTYNKDPDYCRRVKAVMRMISPTAEIALVNE